MRTPSPKCWPVQPAPAAARVLVGGLLVPSQWEYWARTVRGALLADRRDHGAITATGQTSDQNQNREILCETVPKHRDWSTECRIPPRLGRGSVVVAGEGLGLAVRQGAVDAFLSSGHRGAQIIAGVRQAADPLVVQGDGLEVGAFETGVVAQDPGIVPADLGRPPPPPRWSSRPGNRAALRSSSVPPPRNCGSRCTDPTRTSGTRWSDRRRTLFPSPTSPTPQGNPVAHPST